MNNTDPPKLLADAAAIGLQGVEMLTPDLYPVARDVGLELVSTTGHDLDVGFNNPANHTHLTDDIRAKIAHAHDEGIRGVIVHSLSERARGFYLGHGFEPSAADSMLLMVTIADLRAAL